MTPQSMFSASLKG